MATLKMVLTADESKAVQALRRMDDAQRKVTDRFRQMGKGAQRATRETSSGLRDGARSALGFAAALTGIGTAAAGVMVIINQLKREYENLKQRQAAAAETQITMSEKQARARYMLPGDVDWGEFKKFTKRVGKAAEMKPTEVWGAMPSILSAKGAAKMPTFEAVTTIGAKMGKRGGWSSEEIGTFTGSLLDIARGAGLKGPGAGRRAVGWALQYTRAARMIDPERAALALGPVLVKALAVDATPEEAAELVTYISQMAKDPMGKMSSTAAIGLMGATKDMIIPRRRGRAVRWAEAPGKTYQERLGAMQDAFMAASPAVRTQMLSRIGGRKKTRTALESLLLRTPEALEEMAQAERAISPVMHPKVARLTAELFADLDKMRVAPVAKTRRTFESAAEKLRLASPEAMGGEVRQQLPELLKAAGVSDLQQRLVIARFELETGFGSKRAVPTAIKAIRAVQEAKRYKSRNLRISDLPLVDWPWKPSVLTESMQETFGLEERPAGKGRLPNPDYNPELGKKLDVVVTELRAINQQREDAERQGSRE